MTILDHNVYLHTTGGETTERPNREFNEDLNVFLKRVKARIEEKIRDMLEEYIGKPINDATRHEVEYHIKSFLLEAKESGFEVNTDIKVWQNCIDPNKVHVGDFDDYCSYLIHYQLGEYDYALEHGTLRKLFEAL